MGKAQRHRQAITIRFNDEDAELVEWLGQFAQSSNMTKVVKLACYMLSGIHPQEGLLAVLPEEHLAHISSAWRHKTASTNRDIHATLAAVTQEMVALRQEISQQHPAPPLSADRGREHREEELGTANVAASGGLDITSRRRGRPAKQSDNGFHPPRAAEADPATSSQALVQTILEFNSNFQRGR